MKLTIHIADALLTEARKLAVRERTTLSALVQEGLRKIVDERSRKTFVLREVSFKGEDLNQASANLQWEQLRDMAYEGRGG